MPGSASSREADGGTQMVITWEPRVHGLTAPQVVTLKARTPTGTTLFDGRLGQVGSGSPAPADNARFNVPIGRVEIDMAILDASGRSLDTDVRDFDVPDFRRQKVRPGAPRTGTGPCTHAARLSECSRESRRRPVVRPHLFTRRSASHTRSRIRC